MPIDRTAARGGLTDIPDQVTSLERAVGTPERAILINEDFVEGDEYAVLPRSLEFFWNPESLTVNLAAKWAKIAVPGLSHEVMQWSHNPSRSIKFQLQWSSIEAQRRHRGEIVNQSTIDPEDPSELPLLGFIYQDFLAALVFPLDRGKAPSRVSLLWPNMLHMTGVIESVRFNFVRFNKSGAPRNFNAQVAMTELRTTFLSRLGRRRFFRDNATTPAGENTDQGTTLDNSAYGDSYGGSSAIA